MKGKLISYNKNSWKVYIKPNDLFSEDVTSSKNNIIQNYKYISKYSLYIYNFGNLKESFINKFKNNQNIDGNIITDSNGQAFFEIKEAEYIKNNIPINKINIENAILILLIDKQNVSLRWNQAKYLVELAKRENVCYEISNGYSILQKYLIYFKKNKYTNKWEYPQLKKYQKSKR